jgi:hypothetical protein
MAVTVEGHEDRRGARDFQFGAATALNTRHYGR